MKNIVLITLAVLVLSSCRKKKNEEETPAMEPEPGTININGAAQKGPYKNGSPLTIFELNSSLGQTGKSFSSIINDDKGNFSMSNIGLTSGYALVTANGYYYMEHFNQVSSNQLYLEAISDVSGSSVVNINLLTHLIKPRIEDLVSKGNSFAAAKTQAQNEFKVFMGVTSGNTTNFENLDITNDAFLFAVSLLFQRRTAGYISSYNYTSELSGLLSNFRNDFKNNGLIDTQSIIDTLVYNANRIELIDAKDNLQNYFSSLSVSITPPGFEPYIYLFQKKYAPVIHSNIIFPDSALYVTNMPGPPSKMKNILDKSVTNFSRTTKIMSATVPCDSSLVIHFTPYNSASFGFQPPYYGWKLDQSGTSFTLTCQRKNFGNALLVSPSGPGPLDSAKVEYFQNGSSTPYFTKKLYW